MPFVGISEFELQMYITYFFHNFEL